jgi:hypothetical protein
MKAKKASTRREVQNLAVRYGEIGISAVAAAVRYQGEGRAHPLPPARAGGRGADRWTEEMLPEGAV